MLPKISTSAAPGGAQNLHPAEAVPTGSGEPKDLTHSRQASSTSLGSASSSTSTNSKPQAPAPHRTPSGNSITLASVSNTSINKSAHRQSFAEELRNPPASPRRRHASVTQIAVQDLFNNPPPARHNSKFAGREWRDVHVGELTSPDDVRWATLDTSVEEATMLLLKSQTNVVLVRENEAAKNAVTTFDYSDLNSYLLVVVGLSRPEEDQVALFNEIMSKAQQGTDIPLREIQPICRQDTLITVPSDGNLSQAIEVLGSGIHRVLVTSPTGEVTGLVSQLRVVDFFWNEGVHFPSIDQLYPTILRDLGVGTQQIVSVNSDSPLSDALTLMNNEGLTSVAVVDNGQNVVGNISTRDVRHLTSTSAAPLLSSSCMHFISVILNERGVEKGRDAVPVFYVNPFSTLAHTVAKLVATRSHRMWVVESQSPSPSAPATPLMGPQSSTGSGPPQTTTAHAPPSPLPPQGPTAAVPASAMAGTRISGRLNGVISLTDVLNVFAKFSGLHPTDPNEQRARRRRSSSSSMRPSFDSKRASIEIRK